MRNESLKKALLLLTVVVLPLKSLGTERVIHYYKGDNKVYATADSRWAVLESPAKLQMKLERAVTTFTGTPPLRIIPLEPERVLLELSNPVAWSRLMRKLRNTGLAKRHWLGLRRATGLRFYDNELLIKTTKYRHLSPLLTRMKVRCMPARYVTALYRCHSATANSLETIHKLNTLKEVEWAEPNFFNIARLHTTPKDPLLPNQWHLNNDTSKGHIDAQGAWVQTTGAHSTVIAIVDNGIDVGHPDLAPNFVDGIDIPDDDDDPSPECTREPDGEGPSSTCTNDAPYRESHGTAVAGIAVAASNIVFGAGVCPSCGLLAVRFIGERGIFRSLDAAETFERLTQLNVAVVSNSWGPSLSHYFPLSQAENEALHRLTTDGAHGLGALVIFAAGNEYFRSVDINPYTLYPNVMTISASTRQDEFACYSNQGRSISVSAPSHGCFENEEGVTTSDVRGRDGYSNTAVTRDFGGTSAAAPIVAGVAGLVRTIAPQLSGEAVRILIESTADNIETKADWSRIMGSLPIPSGRYDKTGHSLLFGYGRVNAQAAVSAAVALEGARMFAACERDCAICEGDRCLTPCEIDLDCLASQRCVEETNDFKVCRRVQQMPRRVGAPCAPSCEVCAEIVDIQLNPVSICTVTCSNDDHCPTGFDCRNLDDGIQICVPGSKTCGDSWWAACESGVRVGEGAAALCSCDCVEGTTAACPDSMVCDDAFCSFDGASRRCQPAENALAANDFPKCFPKQKMSRPCSAHSQCDEGLYCMDGRCQIDQYGCAVCAECDQDQQCGPSADCVNTLRGRRCLVPCETELECPNGTLCTTLPSSNMTYCLNDTFGLRGICPDDWRCPLQDRCHIPSDCPTGCTCLDDNVCSCGRTPPQSESPSFSGQNDNLAHHSTGNSAQCGCGQSLPGSELGWFLLFFTMLTAPRRSKRQRS